MRMIAAVDGCQAGWLVAMARGWPPGAKTLTLDICRTFRSVLEITKRRECKTVLVDIPIGLLSAEVWKKKGGRECDIEAKQLLKGAAASVFPTPPRECIEFFESLPNIKFLKQYQQFNGLHKKLTEKGVPIQSFSIAGKILEVDREMTPDRQKAVREFHPELVWKRIAGGVLESKHSAAGMLARLSILAKNVTGFHGLSRQLTAVGGGVALDDLCDALIGLAAAHDLSKERRLPKGVEPPRDARGLRMEIWY